MPEKDREKIIIRKLIKINFKKSENKVNKYKRKCEESGKRRKY